MPRSRNPDFIVNKNENHFMSWLSMGDKHKNEPLALHIPKANYLIEKYCREWWKNAPGEWDYQFLQYKLCSELNDLPYDEFSSNTRNNVLKWCSYHLKIKPILLYNDIDLPF